MPAQIDELIDRPDNVEIIRDEIAAILAVELASQQTLAVAAGKDPALWRLRVFLERANPWAEYLDAPDQADAPPIVNVSLDNENVDGSASNAVERQKITSLFNIDCYAYGISADDGGPGHIPGDEKAALEARRAVRLVRNILMSAHYTYLGLRGVVWGRMVRSVTMFHPQMGSLDVQQIVAARVALEVGHNEFSPQVQGEPLELVASAVHRSETGEIYFNANYNVGE